MINFNKTLDLFKKSTQSKEKPNQQQPQKMNKWKWQNVMRNFRINDGWIESIEISVCLIYFKNKEYLCEKNSIRHYCVFYLNWNELNCIERLRDHHTHTGIHSKIYIQSSKA